MAPGQQSPSPSPLKRPSLSERTSSAHSLSSSGRQVKLYRPHVVGQRSGRNTSYGKNLNKLPKINSTQALTTEGTVRNQQQRSSGGSATSPATSPRINANKRNSSNISLKKNGSQTALKKNRSATGLARNQSASHLKKAGLAPLTPARPSKEKQVGFQFGNGEASSDDEEEAEWEDSSHSPETTRQNSAYSTHPATPVDGQSANPQNRHSSPPPPSLREQHRSAPSLATHQRGKAQAKKPPDLKLLPQHTRSTGAPPAMSTISASATKSQTNLSEAVDSKPTVNGHAQKSIPRGVSESTSTENGVSQFLSTTGSSGKSPYLGYDAGNEADFDAPSSFLPNYHPRAGTPQSSSESQPHAPSNPLIRRSAAPVSSRTQQRLDLQRRETMRTGPPTPPSGPSLSSPHDSTLQITRPGSRNRTRVDGMDALDSKARKKEFDSASRHLNVVRRFRNPVTESVARLQARDLIDKVDRGGGKKGKSKASTADPARPSSRAGPIAADGGRKMNGVGPTANGKVALSRSVEEQERRHKPSDGAHDAGFTETRPNSNNNRGGRNRVRFQRQGSHDDIGLSRSRGDTDEDEDEGVGMGVVGEGGQSGAPDERGEGDEQDLLRRMWTAKVWNG